MKRIFVLLSVLMLTLCLTATAFASNGTRTGEVIGGGAAGTEAAQWHHGGEYPGSGTGTGSGGVNLTDPNATGSFVDNELFGGNGLIVPNVSTDTIVGKLESKGNDVVHILQTVGKYVCIAAFIICCILTLVGIIGNKRLLAGAIIGLIISGVAYAGIVCGREIVNWIAAWAVS